MTPFTQVNIVDLWWTPFEIRRHRNSSWHVMAVHLSTPSVHIDMLEFMDLHPLISFTVEGFSKICRIISHHHVIIGFNTKSWSIHDDKNGKLRHGMPRRSTRAAP